MAKRGKRMTIALHREETIAPTPEQLAQGGYARRFVMHAESATETMAYVSRHDPVQRWEGAGKLELHQVAAIELCERLWRLAGIQQPVTANYGERIPGYGNAEVRNAHEIEARKDLHRIQGYFPAKYWNVWENVCRHGEPAGVAGSRLGSSGRPAQERAYTIVCFVADIIAMKERL